jgi:hypothetical protein
VYTGFALVLMGCVAGAVRRRTGDQSRH